MSGSKSASTSLSAGNYVWSSLAKAVSRQSRWEDKDEFLDVVYWLKQLVGVLMGLAWGLAPFKGFVAIVAFFAINSALVYAYASFFQRIDEDEFGGYSEILKEGLMTAFASFLVTWIIVYDLMHGASLIAKF